MNGSTTDLVLPSLLQLLQEWTQVSVGPIKVTSSDDRMSGRGVYSQQYIASGTTLLLLPWKHVLGVSAAATLMTQEDDKGRGIDDVQHLAQHLSALLRLDDTTIDTREKWWTCWMACSLLAAARYPLSAWSTYIASLPETCHNQSSSINAAIRRSHAWTVRHYLKQQFKQPRNTRVSYTKAKLSQQELNILRQAKDSIMNTSGSDIEHVLLWDQDTLLRTGDDTLIQFVHQHCTWLKDIWEQLFGQQHPIIISWESWLWAHAIVASRAIGMDHAPQSILTLTTNNNHKQQQQQQQLPLAALLPLIDMINHSSHESNASLQVQDKGMAVVAQQDIPQGSQVLFNYHPQGTLRFFLRAYGFVNDEGPHHQMFYLSTTLNIKVSISSRHDMIRVLERKVEPIHISYHLTDDIILTSHQNEDEWAAAAAGCCQIVLDSIIQNVKDRSSLCHVADQYRECNISILERCIADLKCWARLFPVE